MSSYDEDLQDNAFLALIRQKHRKLMAAIESAQWTVHAPAMPQPYLCACFCTLYMPSLPLPLLYLFHIL